MSKRVARTVNARVFLHNHWRLMTLIACLLVETLLVVSLVVWGWSATMTGMGLLLAVLPLLIAATTLFRGGVRFQLRSIFLVLACLCLFFAITVAPLIRARMARSASRALIDAGAQPYGLSYGPYSFSGLSQAGQFTRVLNLPSYLSPLAGDLQRYPIDREIRAVELKEDTHCVLLARSMRQLDELDYVEITNGVSDEGIKALTARPSEAVTGLRLGSSGTSPAGLRSLTAFNNLRFLMADTVDLPQRNWLKEFKQLEFLVIRAPQPPKPALPLPELSDLAQLPKLTSITLIGFDLSPADIESLRSMPQIKSINLVPPQGLVVGSARLGIQRILPKGVSPSAAISAVQWAEQGEQEMLRVGEEFMPIYPAL